MKRLFIGLIISAAFFFFSYYIFAIDKENKKRSIPDKRIDAIKITLCSMYFLTDWEAKYYAYMFNDMADTFDIDWELIAAVIWIESKFNPTALSEKDAKGVIQMLETTAEEQAKKLNIPYKRGITVWNPLLQIPLGVDYLATALKKGGYENGIKTYGGGPGWRKADKENTKKLKKYFHDVSLEHKRLKYQFLGVQSDR